MCAATGAFGRPFFGRDPGQLPDRRCLDMTRPASRSMAADRAPSNKTRFTHERWSGWPHGRPIDCRNRTCRPSTLRPASACTSTTPEATAARSS
ncbi:hypothetical protein LUTEI9C_80152 [Luteimonas sp. 9C]|nr:hypothetical protein LUTEI9C_80152 [Luteimonas sp. 9C]